MSTTTLTSLAILKVNFDHGGDYLEYLVPFVVQVLADQKPDPVTDRIVREYILEQFGLEIPERTVQIVLRRIVRRYPLERDSGVYRLTGDFPNPGITARQSDAAVHISSVVYGLQQFSQGTIRPLGSSEDAVGALLTFLAKFDVAFLRSYLRGTAIPLNHQPNETDVVLVSEYVKDLQKTDPDRFGSFLVLTQGHMLANALLCPDLENMSGSYKNVTFYLDTPLLVHTLGVEGDIKQAAISTLIAQLRQLGGKVAAFSHSREELHSVLRGAARYIGSPDGRGPIITESRKRGTTRSDLILLSESVDEKLSEAGIMVEEAPRYIEALQIDEEVFESVLDDEVSYSNPRAREYDINSVRSVYVIRGDKLALSLEKSRAILVTSNSGFARAAWEYGKQHESLSDVSSVMTDYVLANLAWLKAPMGAPSIPHTQVLAVAYAALEPSRLLLDKYMVEIDRLEAQGTITERDHQLLRSSSHLYDELMHLTLGDDAALTEETVTETLERVTAEIKGEASEQLNEEKLEHERTINALTAQQARNREMIKNLYWRCDRRAKVIARSLAGLLCLVPIVELVSKFGFWPNSPIATWILVGTGAALVVMTVASLGVGWTVVRFYTGFQRWCLIQFLRREAELIGMDLDAFFNS